MRFVKLGARRGALDVIAGRQSSQPQHRVILQPFSGLDYPGVSAGRRGHEKLANFRSAVMAGLDPAIQSQSEAPCSFWMAASGATMTMELAETPG